MIIVDSLTGTSSVTVSGLYSVSSNKVDPFFTWKIFRKGTNQTFNWCADDTSWAPWYWNQFQISIPGSTQSIGLTSGIIPLTPGEWIYEIFETMEQYDLTLSTVVGKVQTGLMVVGLTSSTYPQPMNPYPSMATMISYPVPGGGTTT